ncbi:hypothetical protein NHQ30_010385 [Ciborinia camelliae]|nr:hypothetical protein NHQ30_010385 [Ciborinia camelliae]
MPAPQHQPTMPQPAFQPYPYNPYIQFAGHGQHVPFGAGYVPQPAMNTYGASSSEIQLQQMQTPDVNKKQDMKPADDDPFRMYWVRELDDTWTQRNRMTIDSGDIGDVRVSFVIPCDLGNNADQVLLLCSGIPLMVFSTPSDYLLRFRGSWREGIESSLLYGK